MPRAARIIVPHYPHHVMLRGNNRRKLFSYASDYRQILWYMTRALSSVECAVNALVLMTNHIHLVITPAARDDLGRFIKSFAQRYATYRNKKRDATGKLFEQRYEAKLVVDERQLAVLTAYVELNPVRGDLADDPLDYRWSTFGLHAGFAARCEIPRTLWTPTDWYLGLGVTNSQRARAYADWMKQYRTVGERPKHATRAEAIELLSKKRYTLRLERPNRSRAREPTVEYGESARL